jgi:adenylate cyclase class 2
MGPGVGAGQGDDAMRDSLRGRFAVEVKYLIGRPEEAIERILKIGATERFRNNEEHDVYFDFPDQALARASKSLVLRRREPFDQNLLFLKGSGEPRSFAVLVVDKYDEGVQLLRELGVVEVMRFTKVRSMFFKEEFHITVDSLENYGNFLEVGCFTDRSDQVAPIEEDEIALVNQIGYGDSKRERRSYLEILRS